MTENSFPWTSFWMISLAVIAIFAVLYALRKHIGPFVDYVSTKLTHAFAGYAGADISILKTVPSSVQLKRAGLGALMFVVIYVSSILAVKVWMSIYNNFAAALFIGIVWFTLITIMDRVFLTMMDQEKKGSRWKTGVIVTTRILIVLAISYINATMIQMQVFETEIQQVFVENREANIQHVRDSINPIVEQWEDDKIANDETVNEKETAYQAWYGSQMASINAQRDSLRAREAMWAGEIEGIVGSGKKGYGPAAKAKRELITQDSLRLMNAIAEFENAKINTPEYMAIATAMEIRDRRNADIDKDIAKTRAYETKQIAKLTDQKIDGLSDRYDALHVVAGRNVFVYAWFMLFIIIEALTIIVKVMMGRDEYDEAVALQREKFMKEEILQQKLEIAQATTIAESSLMNEYLTQVNAKNTLLGQISTRERIFYQGINERMREFETAINEMRKNFEESGSIDKTEQDKIISEVRDEYYKKTILENRN